MRLSAHRHHRAWHMRGFSWGDTTAKDLLDAASCAVNGRMCCASGGNPWAAKVNTSSILTTAEVLCGRANTPTVSSARTARLRSMSQTLPCRAASAATSSASSASACSVSASARSFRSSRRASASCPLLASHLRMRATRCYRRFGATAVYASKRATSHPCPHAIVRSPVCGCGQSGRPIPQQKATRPVPASGVAMGWLRLCWCADPAGLATAIDGYLCTKQLIPACLPNL